MSSLSDFITSRRSVSFFTKEAVSVELIDELIELAGYAPSSCNTQPWFFLVFHSESSRRRLAEYVQNGYDRTREKLLKEHNVLGGVYVKFLDFFSRYGKFDDAPVYILLFAQPYDAPVFSQAIAFARDRGIEKVAADSVKTSTAMAMQNFLLLAHERGLGTRMKDGVKFLLNFEDLKNGLFDEFHIPRDFELVSGIQLGHPSEQSLKRIPSKRRPFDEIRRIL